MVAVQIRVENQPRCIPDVSNKTANIGDELSVKLRVLARLQIDDVLPEKAAVFLQNSVLLRSVENRSQLLFHQFQFVKIGVDQSLYANQVRTMGRTVFRKVACLQLAQCE